MSPTAQRWLGDNTPGRDADGPRANLRTDGSGWSDSAGDGLGVGIGPWESCDSGGVWDVLIKSAASRTLVGTLFRRIADPVEVSDDDKSLLELVLCRGTSDHGEGSGFSGDISEAEVERLGPAAVKLGLPEGRAIGEIFRRSMDDGRRNSDALLWRALLSA